MVWHKDLIYRLNKVTLSDFLKNKKHVVRLKWADVCVVVPYSYGLIIGLGYVQISSCWQMKWRTNFSASINFEEHLKDLNLGS